MKCLRFEEKHEEEERKKDEKKKSIMKSQTKIWFGGLFQHLSHNISIHSHDQFHFIHHNSIRICFSFYLFSHYGKIMHHWPLNWQASACLFRVTITTTTKQFTEMLISQKLNRIQENLPEHINRRTSVTNWFGWPIED